MKRWRVLAVFVPALVFAAVAGGGAQQRALYQQTQYKGQEIGKLTGDVYYARMDDYMSAFMVTPEGIVLVEPIGTEMATWLKAELARRFMVPVSVRHLSHSHWDHASGGAVYADTARFIGTRTCSRTSRCLRQCRSPECARQDTNGNGRIDR